MLQSRYLLPIAALFTAAAVAAPAPVPPAAPVAKVPAPVWSLAFSPDGATLAAGGYKQVQVWDLATKQPARTLTALAGPVRTLAWSSNGEQLAAGSGKPGELGEVKIFNARAGTLTATLKEHKDVVESVAFSPVGAVVSAGIDEKVLVAEMPSGKVVQSLTDHTNRVLAVAVSPNGKYVATGSLDASVKIWSADEYKPLGNIDTNGAPVSTIAFLPNGDLAVSGADGNVRVYRLSETKSGKFTTVNANTVRTLNGNRTPINAVTASLKGNVLVCGGDDKTVRVFDAANGNRKYTFEESPAPIYAVAVSPDGTLIAAGCRDGKVRLWTAADGKPAGEL